MTVEIYCYNCGNRIDSRDDLYTYLSFNGIHALCSARYARNHKEVNSIRAPINSQSTVLIIILTLVDCTYFSIKDFSWIWPAIALIVPSIRFLSWFLTEREIK